MQHTANAAQPMMDGSRILPAHISVYVIAIVPLIALAAAVPIAWGWGMTWLDVGLTVVSYTIAMLGVTVGFHRYFTHRSFKAHRAMRITLAILGSLAVQGPILHWVATHRRHHAYADTEGDPHSPWQFGTSPFALIRGFWHAHMGWLFRRELTNQRRFVPDLLADRDIRAIHRLFTPIAAAGFLAPAVVGGLATGTWRGALSALFWAGVVRVGLVHHVSWSVNSICHLVGQRPFRARDRAANFAPLAIVSMGDSWHNLHHADPSCARHGVRRGQIDIAGRVIWVLERLRLVYEVRWPTPERLARIQS
ncbi:acyl-CoA desaturase [Micromonospora sp. CA-263727]|uniref:acyl-CoA desaturase n=1 Tax=Micromonospora sp. CA-263727 TaxID=3239967 RepID=UPI003D8E7F83